MYTKALLKTESVRPGGFQLSYNTTLVTNIRVRKISFFVFIQVELSEEYTERVFKTIENSDELENLSPGLGQIFIDFIEYSKYNYNS
jgi:hypothetical protein